jgi:uncharacterized protein YbaR (Trm112 family)
MAVPEELLEILACPKCRGVLIYDRAGQVLDCEECRLRYAIEDDIPVMLIDEARKY